jgi:hypothetical protein
MIDEIKEEEISNEETVETLTDLGGLGVYDKEPEKIKRENESEETNDSNLDETNEIDNSNLEDSEKPKEEENKEDREKDKKNENEESIQVDWESEDNPYKQRHKEAADWGSRTNQELVDLKNQNKQLTDNVNNIRKKFDLADFVPETPKETDTSLQLKQDRQERLNKIKISEELAYEHFGDGDLKKGKEIVNKLVGPGTEFQTLVRTDPIINQRVLSSRSPVMEGIKIMQERDKLKALGSGTLEDMKARMKTELISELAKEAETKKKLKHGPKGLPLGRSGSGSNEKKKKHKLAPLTSLSRLG